LILPWNQQASSCPHSLELRPTCIKVPEHIEQAFPYSDVFYTTVKYSRVEKSSILGSPGVHTLHLDHWTLLFVVHLGTGPLEIRIWSLAIGNQPVASQGGFWIQAFGTWRPFWSQGQVRFGGFPRSHNASWAPYKQSQVVLVQGWKSAVLAPLGRPSGRPERHFGPQQPTREPGGAPRKANGVPRWRRQRPQGPQPAKMAPFGDSENHLVGPNVSI